MDQSLFVLYVIVVIIRKYVIFLKMDRYNVDEDSILIGMSYDGNFYICNTCDCETIECHVRELQQVICRKSTKAISGY